MSVPQEDSGSSSDDSVCFGPYTIKEAKRDAKKGKPRQIDRRHSSIYRFRHYDHSETIDAITAHFGEATNISSNPSEYLTPNETVHTENNKSSVFLEKLSKVINEPISGSTSYNTAFDQTNVHENDASQQEEELNTSVITIDDDSYSQLNTSDCEFVTNESRSPVATHMGQGCQVIAEAISDEYRNDGMAIKHEVDSNNSSLIIEQNAPDCNLSHSDVGDEELNYERVIDNSGDAISLSNSSYSDINEEVSNKNTGVSQRVSGRVDQLHDSSLVVENGAQGFSFSCSPVTNKLSDYKLVDQEETHSSNGEIDGQSVVDKENCLDDSSSDLDLIPPTPQEKNAQAHFDFKQLSKITEKTEFTTFSDRSASTTDFSENIPEMKESTPSSPPVQISSTNLNQFDDSCDFDDTLEEMNRFLEQGAQYVMPEKTPAKTKETSKMPHEDSCAKGTPTDIFRPVSGSFMNNSSQDNPALTNKTPSHTRDAVPENVKKYHSAEKIIRPKIDVKGSKTTATSKFRQVESKIKPPSVFSKALFGKTTPNPKSEPTFKRPTKPAKKITTPCKTLNPSLKNVVSPIGVYINNAPKYCPMIKIPQSQHHFEQESNSSRAGPSSHKENLAVAADFEVPPVIYKPAKTKVASDVREFNLPGNVKKLIAPRVLTRHEQRIEAVDHNQSVDRRLLESDLSINISLQSNPDISIITNRQPYNIKKF